MARPRPYAASPVAVSLLSIAKAEGATTSEAARAINVVLKVCMALRSAWPEGLHGLKV
jgi:hypothetical protein